MSQIGLHDPIGTTQIMAERKVRSQSVNLTPSHYKSRIFLNCVHEGGMPNIVGKLLTRAITFFQTSPQ
jgi:hypothetical protein